MKEYQDYEVRIFEDFDDSEVYQKIKDRPDLVKDKETGAVLNVDNEAYNAYVNNYKKVLKEKQKVNSIETELNEMKNDINEIKNLLRSLAQNK